MRYDAFISYSHAAGDLAPAVQRALHRLARPWYRIRALHVFVDSTNLSASPELWPTIQTALRASKALILLAAPEAARSEWVAREIEFWRAENRGPIYILVTDGEIEWDAAAGDFDYARSTALPPALRGAFSEEPLWIDLRWAKSEIDLSLKTPRFAEGVATLAAALHDMPKEMLIGEDIYQHRRTRRIAGTAIVMLTLLLIAALAAAYVARQQLRRATENLANQLATNALTTEDGRDTALITAVAASRLADTPVTHAALLRVVQRNRYVDALLYPSVQVINIVSLAVTDHGSVAAGLYGGGVEWWDASGVRRSVGQPGPNLPVAFWREKVILVESLEGCTFHDPFGVMPFAAARNVEVTAFAGDCNEQPAIVVCADTCHPTVVEELPRLLALSHDGALLLAVWERHAELRDAKGVVRRRITLQEPPLAAAGDASAFDLLLASGAATRVSASGVVDSAAVFVPKPRYAERSLAAAATGLRRVAFTDAMEGVGLPYVESMITVVTPTDRLSRVESASSPPAPAKITLPPLDPKTLPPWRDGDDHEIDVMAASDDGIAATAKNQRGEGLSPRLVLRGNERPLLVDTGGESVDALAVGPRFAAAALENGTIRLWDRRTGATASEAIPTSAKVQHLAFTATHLRIHYGDRIETIVTGVDELRRLACSIANRDLSPDEWRLRMPAVPYEQVCSQIVGRKLVNRW